MPIIHSITLARALVCDTGLGCAEHGPAIIRSVPGGQPADLQLGMKGLDVLVFLEGHTMRAAGASPGSFALPAANARLEDGCTTAASAAAGSAARAALEAIEVSEPLPNRDVNILDGCSQPVDTVSRAGPADTEGSEALPNPNTCRLADGWAALAGLAARAALVVTDESPVPPDAEWLARLAASLPGGTGVWAVDAACTIPMRLVGRSAVDKAYKFRSATAAPRKARMRDCPYGRGSAGSGSGGEADAGVGSGKGTQVGPATPCVSDRSAATTAACLGASTMQGGRCPRIYLGRELVQPLQPALFLYYCYKKLPAMAADIGCQPQDLPGTLLLNLHCCSCQCGWLTLAWSRWTRRTLFCST